MQIAFSGKSILKLRRLNVDVILVSVFFQSLGGKASGVTFRHKVPDELKSSGVIAAVSEAGVITASAD